MLHNVQVVQGKNKLLFFFSLFFFVCSKDILLFFGNCEFFLILASKGVLFKMDSKKETIELAFSLAGVHNLRPLVMAFQKRFGGTLQETPGHKGYCIAPRLYWKVEVKRTKCGPVVLYEFVKDPDFAVSGLWYYYRHQEFLRLGPASGMVQNIAGWCSAMVWDGKLLSFDEYFSQKTHRKGNKYVPLKDIPQCSSCKRKK